MEIIRKCFTEEVFSYEGRYWQLKDVRMFPKPVQKPHPPMFVSASDAGSAPMERAAAAGWNATTGGKLENWEEWNTAWADTLRRHGKDPAKFQSTTFTALFVSNDPERDYNKYKEDLALTAEAIQRFRLPRSAWGAPSPQQQPAQPRPAPNPFKTPDETVKFLRRCYGKTRPTQLILWSKRVGMTYAESIEHHRLFMDKVAPQIRDLLG